MVSVYHLDLEYLQAVDHSCDTLNLVEKTLEAQLSQLATQSDSQRSDTLVLGSIVWENCNLLAGPALEILESIKHRVNSLGAQFQIGRAHV